jgi:dTMP kinase
MAGLFITFEGGEACGKSTQVARLKKRLTQADRPVITVHEPGYTEIGVAVRHILLHARESAQMLPETELLLFGASRSQLVGEVIRPALVSGKIVVCDRFSDSTIVYQGMARGLSAEFIDRLNSFATGGLKPVLTILLDLDPATARLRRLRRVRPVGSPDRMEAQTEEFFEKVRAGYLELARREPVRIKVIDAARTEGEVEAAIWNEIHGLLG